ncbi:MAG: response regulator [Elusimicrobiota bacterium]
MADVLIFEDDPSVGDMVADLVREKGLTAEHYLSATGAVQIVQESRPRLVILDIMMPGIDGLSACRAIRSNLATKHVKIVILSSKSSRIDKEAASRLGADRYFTKPFVIGEFTSAVAQLLGFAQEPAPPAPTPPAPPVVATLLERGAVLQNGLLWIFFDMGAGTGRWLGAQRHLPEEAWILLSRYDAAAVEDLASGGELLSSGARVKLGGPDSAEASLQHVAPRLCRDVSGRRGMPLLYPQREGESHLAPGVVLTSRHTLHPGSTLAYRVDLQGRRVVYCPAHDIDPSPRAWRSHEADKFRAFFSKAHLLIHGFRRSLSDPRVDDGGGTGAWEPVVDMAAESEVCTLVLLPLPGAVGLEGLPVRVAQRVESKGVHLRCGVARGIQRVIL